MLMDGRVMLFYDLENFKKALIHRDNTRLYDIGRAQYTIMKLLRNVVKIDCDDSCLIRAYVYTGEYTPEIIKRIQSEVEDRQKMLEMLERSTLGMPQKERCSSPDFLRDVKEKYTGQQELMRIAAHFNFFEFKTCPLKYEEGRIFQKGVDVQLAVDLVSHAYKNNFDVAVICSGDIDLLESIRLVKSLGKKVIIMSHPEVIAVNIRKECDFFLDISKIKDAELDEFTRGRKQPGTQPTYNRQNKK